MILSCILTGHTHIHCSLCVSLHTKHLTTIWSTSILLILVFHHPPSTLSAHKVGWISTEYWEWNGTHRRSDILLQLIKLSPVLCSVYCAASQSCEIHYLVYIQHCWHTDIGTQQLKKLASEHKTEHNFEFFVW